MKTNIIRTLLTCAFFIGVLTMNAQTKIYVHKTDGTSTEFNIEDIDNISFTPSSTVSVDYSKIKLNEVSGVGNDPEKFYELINIGEEEVSLEGCKIYYNANSGLGGPLPTGDGTLTWTGKATHIIQPGELLLLLGRYNASSNPNGEFTTGLTPERILIITLKDPEGNVIDKCIRAKDTESYAVGREKSLSRIPDGTGLFYFAEPSPEIMNGFSTTDLIEVPSTQDYLVINEVDGIGKFVEIYNNGTETESLTGLTLVKNETSTWWTGGTGLTLAPGEFYTVAQSGGATGADEYTGASGISPKQNLKFELKKSGGTVIDKFVRTNGKAWGDAVTPAYDSAGTNYSFSRVPDGIGSFQLTVPSCNATNNESKGDIVTNP